MARLKRSWNAATDGRALATELHQVLEISHRQAKGLIDAGCVRVKGEMARSHGLRLAAGDAVQVDFEAERAYQPDPKPSRSADAPFTVLFEDRNLLFVDKPAGLLTVPAEKGNEPTLADALTDHYRRKGMKRVQLYVVHRLDRWTSGVLVFAKTPEAMHGLKAMFESHKLQRVYKAILAGELPENSGTLAGRIVENPKSLRMRVVQPRPGDARPKGAKEAVTHYRVLERLPGHTVVEVKLETGRRNQIRVQFADRGYPLLGDQVYGSPSPLLDRQALHAELLGFRHPVSGEPVSATAPMPPDMEAALKSLRLKLRLHRAEAGKTGEEGLFRPRITDERKLDRVRRAKRFAKPEAGAPAGERSPSGPRRNGVKGARPERAKDPGGERRPPRSGDPRKSRPEGGRPTRPAGARTSGPSRSPSKPVRGPGKAQPKDRAGSPRKARPAGGPKIRKPK